MVAPKGPAARRSQYLEGRASVLIAIIRTHPAWQGHPCICARIRARKAGILETTFRKRPKRTCSGTGCTLRRCDQLMKAGFDTLVEAGYSPEMAYFECVHEMKLISTSSTAAASHFMRYSISDTAEYGDYVSETHHHRKTGRK